MEKEEILYSLLIEFPAYIEAEEKKIFKQDDTTSLIRYCSSQKVPLPKLPSGASKF